MLQLFERYKCKNEWRAHDELILASTMVVHNDKPYLITGGNDDCVAIWELTEPLPLPAKSSKPSTGKVSFLFPGSVATWTDSSRATSTVFRKIRCLQNSIVFA